MFLIDNSLIDWSRAQFALTVMYHWLFVPLTLGMGIIMSLAETKYYCSGDDFWKKTAQFWQKIFGINFAIGVATGIILEFEFGTNWSNYSWFVGDIFGAPLAIEGILAFFMESTFIAVMFFGWGKVSKGFHLASSWLTILGASLSAWWILVANAWMQHPVGMQFNPITVRNEMVDFFAVAFSPEAVVKFLHTVISSWMLAAIVAIAISCWYLLKKRQQRFAVESIKIAAVVGLVGTILTIFTGDIHAKMIYKDQPMKLAAMENLYDGRTHAALSLFGMPNLAKKAGDDQPAYHFNFEVPGMLSILADNNPNAYVAGVNDIIKGGYTLPDGQVALSSAEKIRRGAEAITALAEYRKAYYEHRNADAAVALEKFNENKAYFGYGYIKDPAHLVPHVGLVYYSFRVMVGLGTLFLLIFLWALWRAKKESFKNQRWFHILAVVCVPLVFICTQAGWVVAEVGRQPWAIQDILPVDVAVSKLSTSSVQITFFLFLILFTALLIAELSIMFTAIKKGPDLTDDGQVLKK